MTKFRYKDVKVKKSEDRECFCALCRSPRRIRYSRRLKARHFGQILILAIVFTASTFPWFAFQGAWSLPLIWAMFDSFHKSLYRKELRCPYCGFDPQWYKKDVRLARQKVEEFLKQNPESPILQRARATRDFTDHIQ